MNRVELKNIIPPREIQDAMEKQMKAERQRREAILTAEGEKQSRILRPRDTRSPKSWKQRQKSRRPSFTPRL